MPARALFDNEGGGRPAVASENESQNLRLSNILDQMPVGIGIFDNEGQLYHANRHFEDAAGGALTSLSHMEQTIWRPVPHDGVRIEVAAYPPARAMRGHIATPGMNFIRHLSDGREHWVAMSAVPLRAPGGAGVVGVVVVAENGESRRLNAERLRAKEERFQRFAQHSSNALWIANSASGEIEYLSPAAARMWNDPQLIETLDALDSHVHANDLEPLRRYRQQAVGGATQHFEYRLVDERGAVVRQVREICFPIPGEDGQCEDCIGAIIEDVSPEMQIYLVQPDAGGADLTEQLSRAQRRIKRFSRPDDLMTVADVLNPGCIVLDLRDVLPHENSVTALLAKRPDDLQIILIGSKETAVSDVIAAMRAGAIDFLIEPIDPSALSRALQKADAAMPSPRETRQANSSDRATRLPSLPRREKEVLMGLVSGETNKMIARTLGISPRTIEVHRAHLMERLNVRNLSELLKLAHDAGLKA